MTILEFPCPWRLIINLNPPEIFGPRLNQQISQKMVSWGVWKQPNPGVSYVPGVILKRNTIILHGHHQKTAVNTSWVTSTYSLKWGCYSHGNFPIGVGRATVDYAWRFFCMRSNPDKLLSLEVLDKKTQNAWNPQNYLVLSVDFFPLHHIWHT